MAEHKPSNLVFKAEEIEKFNIKLFCVLDGIHIWVHDRPSHWQQGLVHGVDRVTVWHGPVSKPVWDNQLERNRKSYDHLITLPRNVDCIESWARGRVKRITSPLQKEACPYCNGTGIVSLLITSIKCPDCS